VRKGQVLVRAIQADGKWGNVDVLNLDEESFRAFVLQRLWIGGLLMRTVDESGEEVILKERKDE